MFKLNFAYTARRTCEIHEKFVSQVVVPSKVIRGAVIITRI